MHPSSNNPHLFSIQQCASYGKQNISCYSTYEPTDRHIQNDTMLKEFQTLKQINRILDSNPESQEAKDQKIRSLVVMFKRQLDLNKKLQNQVADFQKKIQGVQKELLVRNTQIKNYEKTIFDQGQKIIAVESQNRRLNKLILENKEEIKVREDLIQKMKQTYENQKYSMENQLHFLKQKTIEHFSEKLNFPLDSSKERSRENITKKQRSQSRTNSSKKSQPKSASKSKKETSSSKNIIQRNILAISKKQNEFMSGENLLKKFQEAKLLSERMAQIRKGNYHSSMGTNC